MGRKTNKKDLGLKTLLDPKIDGDMRDDFDREALEGYSMLKNQQEAFDLKAELDDRMESELSGASKKRPAALYLLAAASLFLVIGLSVYMLFLRDQTRPSELKQLAVSSSTDAIPAPPVLSEHLLEPPVSEVPEPKRGETILDREKKKSYEQTSVTSAKPAAGRAEFNLAPGQTMPPAPEEKHKANSEMEYAAKADAERERDKQINATALESEDEAAHQAPAAKKNEKELSRKRVAPQGREQNKMTDSYAMATSTGIAPLELNTGNCYYDGGEARLQKELSQKLEVKKLDKHFEAILFINSKGKVAKVEFIKNESFSQDEVKQATAILQTLTKFSFVREPGTGYLCEYKLVR